RYPASSAGGAHESRSAADTRRAASTSPVRNAPRGPRPPNRHRSMSAPRPALVLEAELLHRLALALGSAERLDEVAQLGIDATAEALPGRGVTLLLWSAQWPNGGVEAHTGPEMSERMHRQPLASGGHALGEL